MASFPVYTIRDFRKFSKEDGFYANYLNPHIRLHDFTNVPHKHDFFFLALFTKGSGTHEIDFKKYLIKPGSLFILRPGQMHNWKTSGDCDGYVFFHTGDFYDQGFTTERVQDYPFYAFGHASPLVLLKNEPYSRLKELLKEITGEYLKEEALKFQKLRNLVSLVYIALTRLYNPVVETVREGYLDKLRKFEALIDQHFRELKSAGDYAGMMHISEKHLNRISKACLKKTSTELIAERIVLEAKRMLLHSKLSVTQIADELGYKDNSYFTRLFKKHSGETPLDFLKHYRH